MSFTLLRRAPGVLLPAIFFLCHAGWGPASADDAISATEADHPEARWRFEGEALAGAVGKVELTQGATRRYSHTLPEHNQGVRFHGDGGRIEIEDRPELRFDQGDTITIEAWARLEGIEPGANVYLIGKGRGTSNAVNQNWALRLADSGGSSKLSFLFRSRPDGDFKGDYHRWTSSLGISPDGKWHHLAVTYTFGEPKSIKGFIDGKASSGKWDMGGETERPPVVDADRVVIGSSRGGAPSNSFHGDLDEIAVYRKSLPDQRLAQRYKRVIPDPLPPQLDRIGEGEVLVEVRETGGNPGEWPDLDQQPDETFPLDAFSLTCLPNRYNERGVRTDRRLPLHVRLAGKVDLPPGKHTLLLRAPGMSRLSLDGSEVAAIPAFGISGSAHGAVRTPPAEASPYPRLRMGTRELTVEVEGGSPRLVVVEAMIGNASRRLSVNEFLVAIQPESGSSWNLLTSAGADLVPFTSERFAALNEAQKEFFAGIDTKKRREALVKLTPEIEARHARARAYLATLSPVRLPDGIDETSPSRIVDAFLLAKIDRAREGAAEVAAEAKPNHAEVVGLLESQCYRCHGEKAQGGLKLNSREAALGKGESGLAAVVPGKPDDSELIYRLTTDDRDEVMPPKGHGFTPEQVEKTRQWIADGAPWVREGGLVAIPQAAEPLSFLRRLYLNTVGVLPTPEEARSFLTLPEDTRVASTVDRLLEDPRHADHWVSYWQDVLAENPRLIKPVLNNSGPFRYWLHESLLDGKPMDQFVADLVAFEGSIHGGGAGGFSRAAENDVPMAAKAHIVGTAFLGVEMKCARCHDSPYHSTKQEDLFSLAALLSGKPVTLPKTSTVPPEFFQREGKANSVVKVTLQPGTAVAPKWPFPGIIRGEVKNEIASRPIDVAWEIVRPENERFARVMVNRVWKRYFGEGFVEPVHDWEGNAPSHPDLLEWLARDFVASGYDLRHLSRVILNTEAFGREARFARTSTPDERFFEAPLRQRFSAEQLVDSLLSASGVPNYSEELTFDVEGVFPAQNFLNLGFPHRAWEMVSTASDRDRPSLTLPNADSILTVMSANGWRGERAEPVTERLNEANVIQPGMLANGLLGTWVTRLSDYSDLTGLAITAKSPSDLVDDLFLRYLTRTPTEEERAAYLSLLEPGFDDRLATSQPDFQKATYLPEVREVSWTNHLSVEANEISARLEAKAYKGPASTEWIKSDWRERMEDAVWALVNSPEMAFVP
ncbi:MAG: DUF1553 domain-containing protein [Verrucomicrobiae bacterium]|nr:DUF1553 domain-containing protein [Verrucomicrobiae bacterium]